MSDKTNLKKGRSPQDIPSTVEEEFEKNPYLNLQEIHQLAQEVGLDPRIIDISSNEALLEPFLLTTKYRLGSKVFVKWRTKKR
jgi:hypothetical protein